MEKIEAAKKYIRINRSPQQTEIEVCCINWEGPHTPIVKWKTVRKLDTNIKDHEVELIIENLINEPAYFLKCTNCNKIHIIGHMYDEKICHACASSKYGIVY